MYYIDSSGNIPIPLIIAGAILLAKAIDYGWTAWDIADSSKILADSKSKGTDKILAGMNIGLALGFEALEPDDLTPVSVPFDDFARKAAMKTIKNILDTQGPVAVKNYIRKNFGSSADNVIKIIDNTIEGSVKNSGKWAQGSYDSIKDSLIDHFYRHGKEVGAKDIDQYLRKAEGFASNLKGARTYKVDGYVEGATKYIKNGSYIILAPDKTILSFGKVVN